MYQKAFNAIGVLSLLLVIAGGIYLLKFKQQIVYVDSIQLVNGYKGMQSARNIFEQKSKLWKANVDTLTNEVKNQILNYEKENPKMTAREKKLSQDLIKAKQTQLVDYQRAISSQAQEQERKMMDDVVNQINAFLKKYGNEHGYTVILAATEYGNIAYADEGLNITKDVLEKLNNEYSGK